jgi:hypothetical protein
MAEVVRDRAKAHLRGMHPVEARAKYLKSRQ